jgi:(2S)-methylsuccinyl-CoA dehydrogenase
MPHDGQSLTPTAVLADLLALTEAALPEVEALFSQAREALRERVTVAGKISAAALEEHQFAAHTLAWLATYAESLRQMRAWAGRIESEGQAGRDGGLILQIGFGEYLCQIHGGIPMSQGEMARLQDLGLQAPTPGPAAATLMAHGNTAAARQRLSR